MTSYWEKRDEQLQEFEDAEIYSALSEIKLLFEYTNDPNVFISYILPTPVIVIIKTLMIIKGENLSPFRKDIKFSGSLVILSGVFYLAFLWHLGPLLLDFFEFVYQPSLWQEFLEGLWQERTGTTVIFFLFYRFTSYWAMVDCQLTNAFYQKYDAHQSACLAKWKEIVDWLQFEQESREIQREIIKNSIGQAISQYLATADITEDELEKITRFAVQKIEQKYALEDSNKILLDSRYSTQRKPAYGKSPLQGK